MTTPVYCDGIESISLAHGMVRMELFAFEGVAAKGKQPARKPAGLIVMPPRAFLQAFGSMQKLMAELESKGLVRRQEPRKRT